MNAILFTQEGYQKIQEEYEQLEQKRQILVQDVKKYREMGDLSENAAYKSAKFSLGQTNSRLRYLHRLIVSAKIIRHEKKDTIEIGSTVVIKNNGTLRTVMIVGTHEANPLEGKISSYSPIGKALLGEKVNSRVNVQTDTEIITYKVMKIE